VTFKATAWKRKKTSPGTLATKELDVVTRQRIVSHFLFHQKTFDQKTTCLSSLPTLLFSESSIEDETENSPF
jgi:hypothetical protein